MKDKVITHLAFDKVRGRDMQEVGIGEHRRVIDSGEFIRKRVYFIDQPNQTPKGEYSKVVRIREEEKNDWLCYHVEFENGEVFTTFPVPPFDVGYDDLKQEENKEDGQESN